MVPGGPSRRKRDAGVAMARSACSSMPAAAAGLWKSVGWRPATENRLSPHIRRSRHGRSVRGRFASGVEPGNRSNR